MKDSLDRIDFATRRKGGVDSRIVIVCEYSKSGQIVARTANGVRQTYEYDRKGQLLAVKDSDGNAVERYAYDKAGNMLKKQILRSGRAGAPRTPQSDDYITTTFTFDDANQLVSSTTDGVTPRYAYDGAECLVREGNKTYRYGYLDKVMSVSDGDTTRTFTYHADGQPATASYGRADANRGTVGRGDPTAPQSETFLWDGLALIQRGDEQFVNEPHVGGGNPVASSKGTSYFNDALGTTVGSKSNGKYSAAALTAFGENHLTTEPPNHQTFFTGKALDLSEDAIITLVGTVVGIWNPLGGAVIAITAAGFRDVIRALDGDTVTMVVRDGWTFKGRQCIDRRIEVKLVE